METANRRLLRTKRLQLEGRPSNVHGMWAEEQVTNAILIATEKYTPELLQLPHIAENSKGEEKLQVELFEIDYDGSEISDSE